MLFIWLFYFIGLLVISFFNINGFFQSSNTISLIFILLHVQITTVVIYARFRNKIIIVTGFLVRVICMFLDIFGRNFIKLPNSGSDSESFFEQAVFFSKNINSITNINGELYSKIMGIIFHFTGPERILGQYLNVLLGLSTIYVLGKIMNVISINYETQKKVLLIAVLFPNSIIMSSIFLRESFPTFFIAISILCFVKWMNDHKQINFIGAIIFLLIASIFHSAVIGISMGYIFSYLFYDYKTNRFKFSIKTIFLFALVILVVFTLYFKFNDLIFSKFKGVEGIDDILEKASRPSQGGSGYLKEITLTNPIQIFIYGPIRSLYFIGSPVPFDWRGLSDVLTFITDSLLYLGTIFLFIKNYRYIKKNKPLIISLFVMILGVTFIFGIGVGNAGTAMRHRQKLIVPFLSLLSLVWGKIKMNANVDED